MFIIYGKRLAMKKFIFFFAIISTIWVLIVYAQNQDPKFSHKFHAEEVEASCEACHEAALSSTSPADNLLPDHESCYACHDEDETECSYCHNDPDNPQPAQRITELKAQFAHAKHAQSDEDCMKCHAGILEDDGTGTVVNIPGQNDCADCHGVADFYEEKGLCLTCHSNEFNFVPETHSLLWKKNHGPAWQLQDNSCSHCHQQSYCLDCHQGDNLDRLSHPLNYVFNHGIDAKGNKDNCLTCHEEHSFCIDCHQTEMVMPRNHSYAGWSNTLTGGLHARAALYDFDTCNSCHNDAYTDNVCLRCH